MIMRKLRGDPKELDETVLETELRKIVDEPKNGVEADIPLLFHGIHMDMKDDDVLSRVCKFLADCDERIEARVMKGHLKKPEMRKKIFKRLLEVVDPEPVRDACVLDMEKAWHPVEFTWESISELVMHHAQEQQRFYSTYGAGRKKPGYEAKEAKNKKEHRKDDYSRQEQREVRPRRDDRERSRSQGRDRRDRSSDRHEPRGYRSQSRDRDGGRPYEWRDENRSSRYGPPDNKPKQQVGFAMRRGRSPAPSHGGILRDREGKRDAGWGHTPRSNSQDKNRVKSNWSRGNSVEKPKAVEQSSNQAYPLMFGEIDMDDYDEDGNLVTAATHGGYVNPFKNRWESQNFRVLEEQKREAKKRKAKELVETEDFIPLTNDSEDEVDEPDMIRQKGRTILKAKSAGPSRTVRRVYGWESKIKQREPREIMPTGCLKCGDAAHLYDKCPGASAEDRAKVKYEWALVAKRMQNGKTLKPKAKKLRDSLMTANKKWREEQEKSREAKATEPEKKKLRRMLESPAGESVATINGVLDVPYCPDNGSDVGIISTAMVKTLRKLDETVQAKQLPKAWVGSAVRNLPVIAKTTVELQVTLSTAAGQVKLPGKQLFYVVDDNDELII
ncbi:hypothetical protein AaE_014629, partial [Aphanomyces astaci]